jgi:hypothetical protein
MRVRPLEDEACSNQNRDIHHSRCIAYSGGGTGLRRNRSCQSRGHATSRACHQNHAGQRIRAGSHRKAPLRQGHRCDGGVPEAVHASARFQKSHGVVARRKARPHTDCLTREAAQSQLEVLRRGCSYAGEKPATSHRPGCDNASSKRLRDSLGLGRIAATSADPSYDAGCSSASWFRSPTRQEEYLGLRRGPSTCEPRVRPVDTMNRFEDAKRQCPRRHKGHPRAATDATRISYLTHTEARRETKRRVADE